MVLRARERQRKKERKNKKETEIDRDGEGDTEILQTQGKDYTSWRLTASCHAMNPNQQGSPTFNGQPKWLNCLAKAGILVFCTDLFIPQLRCYVTEAALEREQNLQPHFQGTVLSALRKPST